MDRSEHAERRDLSRLSLLNGLIIGLLLAGGFWLPTIVIYSGVRTGGLTWFTIVAGAICVVLICTLAGWLSGRLRHTVAALLIWLAAAILVIVVVAYRPYQLSTFFAWLSEPALWGRPIFPNSAGTLAGAILSGFFVLLALTVLALLQAYRLEGLLGEVQAGGRITPYGWSRLLLAPLLLALPAAIVTGNIFGDRATSNMLQQMQRAIDVAAAYDGDLFALGLQEGINYAALRGVQEQLGAEYTLDLVQTDPETAQTIITAHFDDGAWINCRFINEQLSFCEDASAPYTVGFASLISGAPPACDDCAPQLDESWASWLAERRAAMGDDPQIRFVRQRGAHVLMHAFSGDGERAIACWFEGSNPVRLLQCEDLPRE